LSIFFDSPDVPVLNVAVDIEALLQLHGGSAWVGFTAATGDATENHDILAWSFSELGTGPADADQDGILDPLDNCRSVANPGQEDSDGDGVGNACDNCPAAANSDQADADGEGLGDVCDPFPYDPDNLGACLDSLDTCRADLASCEPNLTAATAALSEGHAGLREILRLVSLPPGRRQSTFACSGELCGGIQAVIRSLLAPPGRVKAGQPGVPELGALGGLGGSRISPLMQVNSE
jgi:hypothetical protein